MGQFPRFVKDKQALGGFQPFVWGLTFANYNSHFNNRLDLPRHRLEIGIRELILDRFRLRLGR